MSAYHIRYVDKCPICLNPTNEQDPVNPIEPDNWRQCIGQRFHENCKRITQETSNHD